jgi:ADP-ribose pyrophosphatase YjhB (NUDIX family)
MNPKFNNRHNEEVTLSDGRVIWLSRSSAVTTTVLCRVAGKSFILLGKRGVGCPDEVGKWNLPCGYLDWDETLSEAAVREVFEETGVNLTAIPEASIVLQHMQQPWRVNSGYRPGSKQNVSHHFYTIFDAAELPATSTEFCEPDEIAELQWREITNLDGLDYAFGHEGIMREFLSRQEVSAVLESK